MNRNGVILTIVIIVLIVIGIIGYAAYSAPAVAPTTQTESNVTNGGPTGNGSNPATTNQNSPLPVNVSATTTVTASSTVSTTASTVKSFTIKGGNYYFTPSAISVNKGDTVKITFVNADGFHDFKIDELNVAAKPIQGGQQETVEFVATKTGSFEYYCSIGTHRQMGMKGTLTVQ